MAIGTLQIKHPSTSVLSQAIATLETAGEKSNNRDAMKALAYFYMVLYLVRALYIECFAQSLLERFTPRP